MWLYNVRDKFRTKKYKPKADTAEVIGKRDKLAGSTLSADERTFFDTVSKELDDICPVYLGGLAFKYLYATDFVETTLKVYMLNYDKEMFDAITDWILPNLRKYGFTIISSDLSGYSKSRIELTKDGVTYVLEFYGDYVLDEDVISINDLKFANAYWYITDTLHDLLHSEKFEVNDICRLYVLTKEYSNELLNDVAEFCIDKFSALNLKDTFKLYYRIRYNDDAVYTALDLLKAPGLGSICDFFEDLLSCMIKLSKIKTVDTIINYVCAAQPFEGVLTGYCGLYANDLVSAIHVSSLQITATDDEDDEVRNDKFIIWEEDNNNVGLGCTLQPITNSNIYVPTSERALIECILLEEDDDPILDAAILTYLKRVDSLEQLYIVASNFDIKDKKLDKRISEALENSGIVELLSL